MPKKKIYAFFVIIFFLKPCLPIINGVFNLKIPKNINPNSFDEKLLPFLFFDANYNKVRSGKSCLHGTP